MTENEKIVDVHTFVCNEKMENIAEILLTFIEGLKNNTLSEEDIYNINVDLIVALIEVEQSSLELKEISYVCLVTTNHKNLKIEYIESLMKSSMEIMNKMIVLREQVLKDIKQELVKYNNLINIDQRTFLVEIRRIIDNVYENHTRASLNFSRMMRNEKKL
jgi:hypothetical protein